MSPKKETRMKPAKPAKTRPKLPPRVSAERVFDAAQASVMDGALLMQELSLRVNQESIARTATGSIPKFKHRREKRGVKIGSFQPPARLAALDMHRAGTQFKPGVGPVCKKCDRVNLLTGVRCKGPAVKNSNRCMRHGGRAQHERNLHAKFEDYKPDRALLGVGVLRQIVRAQTFPMELVRDVPEFAEAYKRARFGVAIKNPLFEDWSYAQRRKHHEACVGLVLRFLAAWEAVRVRGDFREWSECVRDAAAMGLRP